MKWSLVRLRRRWMVSCRRHSLYVGSSSKVFNCSRKGKYQQTSFGLPASLYRGCPHFGQTLSLFRGPKTWSWQSTQPCKRRLNRDCERALILRIFNPLTFSKPFKKGCNTCNIKFNVDVATFVRDYTVRSATNTSFTRAAVLLPSQCLRFFLLDISNFLFYTF